MNQPNESAGLLTRLQAWIRESISLKIFSIGILVLLLLIPTAWIQALIEERQQRAQSVVNDISETWSGEQVLLGPVLVVPFLKKEMVEDEKRGVQTREYEELAFVLPQTLEARSEVLPTRLHRGIFEAAVYESQNELRAHFGAVDLSTLGIAASSVLWNKCYLIIGISDLRGVSSNPAVKWGEQTLEGEPTDNIGILTRLIEKASTTDDESSLAFAHAKREFRKGIKIPVTLSGDKPLDQEVMINLAVKGSRALHFMPAGKTSTVVIKGNWDSPSFVGNFSPTDRKVSAEGFEAKWRVLHYNRPFEQQWVGSNRELSEVDFGVRLLIPVGQYQKSMRTAKYGILVILLSFVALLLVELITKARIHAFQYILIGAALIVYYSLLLSFSEHIGFNPAYLISSGCTVALVALYVFAILKNQRITLLFSSLLTFFYLFVFVIIQLQDYSLLVGSVGLFTLVAALMYVSRKVNWYGAQG